MRRILVVVAVLLLAGTGLLLLQGGRAEAVRALVLQAQPFEQWVVSSGQVRYQVLARIGTEITGTVAERLVREGDLVQAGDPLLRLRRDEWQAQYDQAQTALAQLRNQLYPQALEALTEARLAHQQAEREARRRERLAAQGMLGAEQSEQAWHLARIRKAALNRSELQVRALRPGGDEESLLLQRLESAKASLDKTLIGAPFAGRIQTRNVEPGDQVQPGEVLLELARLDGLEVVAAVDEKYMAPLQPGQSAVVIADAWPEQELPARVRFIAPAVDEASGILDVHLDVEDAAGLLRQGMTVSVSILSARKERALMAPRDYLQQGAQGWYVYVLQQDRAVRVPVRTGLRDGVNTELLEGVEAGMRLLLPDDVRHEGQRVRPIVEAG